MRCSKKLYKPSICQICGTRNPSISKFCSECGSKIQIEPKIDIENSNDFNNNHMPSESKLNQVSDWRESCPVCRKSGLNYHSKKEVVGGFLRRREKILETYECDYCGAVFLKMDQTDIDGFKLTCLRNKDEDTCRRVWEKYRYKVLDGNEWAIIPEGYRTYDMVKIGDVKYFGDESLRPMVDTLLDSYFFSQDFPDNRNIKALEELKSRFYSDLKKEGIYKYRIDHYADNLEYKIREYPDPFLYRYYPVLGDQLNCYIKDFASSSIKVDVDNKKIINDYNSLNDLLNLLTEEKIEDYTTELKVDKNELNKILNKCLNDAYDKIVDYLNSDYDRDFKDNFISTGNMLILESKIRIDGKFYDWEILDFLLKE